MKSAKKRDEEIIKLKESTDRRLREKDEEIKQLREDTNRRFQEKDDEIRQLKEMLETVNSQLESTKIRHNILNVKVQGLCCLVFCPAFSSCRQYSCDYCCTIQVCRPTCTALIMIRLAMYDTTNVHAFIKLLNWLIVALPLNHWIASKLGAQRMVWRLKTYVSYTCILYKQCTHIHVHVYMYQKRSKN